MQDYGEQVLGISDFVNFAGSPTIPIEAVTLYFAAFFILLAVIYFVLHRYKKPLHLSHKLKLLFDVTIILKMAMVGVVAIILTYWLVPTPKVYRVTPSSHDQAALRSPGIEIDFDRPVRRSELEKSIAPEVPGVWLFEDSFYATHLYRKVVFYPTVSLDPDTTYTVTLKNIKSIAGLTEPEYYSYSFTTEGTPKVASVTPSSGKKDISPESKIEVRLSTANDKISEFDFTLTPPHPVSVTLNPDKKAYILTPKEPFEQGVSYTLAVKKTDLTYRLPENTIIKRGETKNEYLGSFTTKEAPGLSAFAPSGTKVLTNQRITMTFSAIMHHTSVEKNLSITPSVDGVTSWEGNTLTFTPKKLEYGKEYTVRVPKGTRAADGSYLAEDIVKKFTTIGNARIDKFYPSEGWGAVALNNEVRTNFDQEVDHASAEEKFNIAPHVNGKFYWEGNTMVFKPNDEYQYDTEYTVSFTPGIKSIYGLPSNSAFATTFKTQSQTVKLDVPSYLQKYALSCEAAALRMALGYRGIGLSEDDIISKLGFDNTPNSGGLWGDPHTSFVGNINGRQMVDGYGTYWEPIARIASDYRKAQDFTNWTIGQITDEILKKNPVVVWVYSSNGAPVTWNTVSGKTINAVRGEHAVVAVGFVGKKENPTQIIVNDPLLGQIYWPRGFFEEKWKTLGNSGVVVF